MEQWSWAEFAGYGMSWPEFAGYWTGLALILGIAYLLGRAATRLLIRHLLIPLGAWAWDVENWIRRRRRG